MSMEEHFCKLSMNGGFKRVIAHTDIPMEVDVHDVRCRRSPIVNWGVYHLDLDRKDRLEDMPWIMGGGEVVSDRLRAFLERYAPGQLQFLPIQTRYKKKPLPAVTYWVMKTLKVLDCINFKASTYKPMEGQPHRVFMQYVVFDLDAIPQDVMIFRSFSDEVPLYIRNELRIALEGQGMTGCQFYPVNSQDAE
jgi:hypothetical protein